MNHASRTVQLAKILLTSQLRSSRSKNGKSRIWDRPIFILVADILCLSLASIAASAILSSIPATFEPTMRTLTVQALAFTPVFALAMVVLAGIIFELNASSRFASSDTINWLPISKSEYVAASASSVAYIYSPYLLVAMGVTLALSIRASQFLGWTASLALSLVTLLTGGFLIEIVRASINRVYSAMSKKTGRTTLFLRLAIIILILVAFQTILNPNLLFTLINGFVGTLDAAFFLPLIWPSLTILAVTTGNLIETLVYGSLTIIFVLVLFAAAVLVRSRYWAPSPASISLSHNQGYAPRYSRLGSLGFSNAEASIVSKDFKAYVRQKELIPFLAMPFTFSAVIVLQQVAFSSDNSASVIPWLAAWMAAFLGVFLAASSIGVEGKSILSLYTVPVHPRELVRAKIASSLVLTVGGAILMSLIAGVFSGFDPLYTFKVSLMTVLGAVQSVFVGVYFATRYSDFTVRPKPRYISTTGMLIAALTATGLVALTIASVVLLFDSQPYLSVPISLGFFALASVVFYRHAVRRAGLLMAEMKS